MYEKKTRLIFAGRIFRNASDNHEPQQQSLKNANREGL